MNNELEFAPELSTSHWINSDTPITLKSLRGKVVVIEAFQMLCPGCVSHGLPQAMRIRQSFSEADVTVLGLHTVFEHHEAQGSKEALAAFMHEYQINFPVGIDLNASGRRLPETMARYGLRGTPSLVLIDREGRFQEQFFGSVSDISIGAKIMELVMNVTRDVNDPAASHSGGCDSGGCAIGAG